MPGDVLIGTNEDEPGAIETIWRGEPQRLQRHATRLCGALDCVWTLRRAKIEQRKSPAEFIVRGAALSEPEMRRPRAGTIDRRVAVPRIKRCCVTGRANDRRALIPLAELDADGE